MHDMADVLIEQRLRTTGLSVALGAIALFVIGLFTTVAQSATSMPTPALIIGYGVPMVLVLVAIGATSIVVRVKNDAAGPALEIAYAFDLFHQRFSAADIERASAVSLSFVEMGGWGYRGSLRLFKYAALATRRGQALELHLVGRKRFVVTVDHPDRFVAALRAAH
jgi:hypothetical protein